MLRIEGFSSCIQIDTLIEEDDDLVLVEEGGEEAEEGEGGQDGHGVRRQRIRSRQSCVHFQTAIFQRLQWVGNLLWCPGRAAFSMWSTPCRALKGSP